MYPALKRFWHDKEGVTAIEFALLAPPLIFLLLGIIEYSIIFHLQSLATHAGNEAARMGKTGANYCAAGVQRRDCVEAAIRNVMGSWISASRPLVSNVSSLGRLGGGGFTFNTAGGSDELVLYQSIMYWRPITPIIFDGLADPNGVPIVSSVLTKNEAF